MNVSRIAAVSGAVVIVGIAALAVNQLGSDGQDKAGVSGVGLLSAAVAQPPQATDKDSIVQPTLMADTTAVKPGTTFTLGILYKVQPDWHIYYKSPGASGFATTVKWGLPAGASMGETLYPAPVTFESPGPVISFGYEDEVMLQVEARVPELPSDGKVQITAKTRWLMCSDRCIPNSKDLTLTLPVGDGRPANREIFDKYRKRVPQVASELPKEAVLKATPSGSTMNYELTITPPADKKLAAEGEGSAHPPYFYPADQDGYVIEPPAVKGNVAAGNGQKVYEGPVTITWKAEPGVNEAEPLKRLAGTLVYQTVTGTTPDAPVLLEIDKKI